MATTWCENEPIFWACVALHFFNTMCDDDDEFSSVDLKAIWNYIYRILAPSDEKHAIISFGVWFNKFFNSSEFCAKHWQVLCQLERGNIWCETSFEFMPQFVCADTS